MIVPECKWLDTSALDLSLARAAAAAGGAGDSAAGGQQHGRMPPLTPVLRELDCGVTPWLAVPNVSVTIGA
jgi:hypothetical protein